MLFSLLKTPFGSLSTSFSISPLSNRVISNHFSSMRMICVHTFLIQIGFPLYLMKKHTIRKNTYDAIDMLCYNAY